MITAMYTMRLTQFKPLLLFLVLYAILAPDIFNIINNVIEYKNVSSQTAIQELLVLQTGFYYNTSVFYSKNTAVILFFADQHQNATEWTCRSSNFGETLNSKALVRHTSNFALYCPWTTYFLTCPTVLKPLVFRLTVLNAIKTITIPLELPERQPRGIVSCFASMFYEQRWQTIIFIHELYAAWGIDLQVHYVQSVVGDILKLLDPFVERGLLEIRPFDIADYGLELTHKLGYMPAQATAARHQVMSHQDCFFRYRESAEFIMIADVDDLFLPMHGKTLYDEFTYWKNLNPIASAFLYDRKESFIQTSGKLDGFSFKSTLESIEITEKEIAGKSIYNPRFTETPWMHWPGINNTPVFNVPSNESNCLHLHYAYDEPNNIINKTVKIENVIDITSLFNETIIDLNAAKVNLKDLPDRSLDYSYLVGKCKGRLFAMYEYPHMLTINFPCTTATSCYYEPRNVNCSVAFRSYESDCILSNRLCAIIPLKVLPDIVARSNGCAWGNFDNYNTTLNLNI
uniref:Glycosyltransferase family 92 protein n=1 Tax=Panagrellus redivivus TaxID=6233 RepID=A0A7E4UQY3_PANRE